MAEKEKAQQIYSEMYFYMESDSSEENKESAKSCAKIVCSEIHKALSNWDIGYEGDYWSNVQKEIEKI